MKILLIDNDKAGDRRSWNPHLGEVLEGLWDADVDMLHYLETGPALDLSRYDGLVLGSRVAPWDVDHLEDYERECEVIRLADKPILGICGGHQLIGKAFGVPVRRMSPEGKGENGYRVVRPAGRHPIFNGAEEVSLLVREFHTDCVPSLPRGFDLLASSPRCQIQMMAHRERPILGMQFHPERYTDKKPLGRVLLLNARKMFLRS